MSLGEVAALLGEGLAILRYSREALKEGHVRLGDADLPDAEEVEGSVVVRFAAANAVVHLLHCFAAFENNLHLAVNRAGNFAFVLGAVVAVVDVSDPEDLEEVPRLQEHELKLGHAHRVVEAGYSE